MSTVKELLAPTPDDSPEWKKCLSLYIELLNIQAASDAVLDILSGDCVKDLLEELRLEERRNLELRVAQSNKISPQNVTEEMVVSHRELLAEEDSSLRRIAKSNVKVHGRSLLQRLHPDKGGDPVLFDIAKKAIENGDAELIYLLRYRFDLDSDLPSEIYKRLLQKMAVFTSSGVHRLTAMYFSQPLERVVEEARSMLRERIMQLKIMNIGAML